MEFANKIRIQLYLVKTIKGDIGRILIALAKLAMFCKIFGYKVTILVLFGIYIAQPVQAATPTNTQQTS
jgi:energy-converting hydrogenase Eha subunit F